MARKKYDFRKRTLTFDSELAEEIDRLRGFESRSSFVRRLLRGKLGLDKPSKE